MINQPVRNIGFQELMQQLGIVRSAKEIKAPRGEPIRVLNGGPVESGRGFVLHTDDVFIDNSTLAIEDNICLTATLDILRSITQGEGPAKALLALGYAGWGAGQLESEIQANGWLHCAADPALLFDDGIDTKYNRALHKIGIDPAFLSSQAGHA